MNQLSNQRGTQVINCLVEGNSIRSTERMTGIHRDTIMRLMVGVGNSCDALMQQQMKNLRCRRIQVDEIWTYVGKKQRWITKDDDQTKIGDMWTFVAIDADTKLVPTYRVGKRNLPTATAFLSDLSSRLENRIQLSSDAMKAYVEATERAFGANVDYAQIVKIYEAEPIGAGRYSPPQVVSTERTNVIGRPDPAHVSTGVTTVLALLRAEHIGVREYRTKLSEKINKDSPSILTVNGEPKQVVIPYSEMIALMERLLEHEKCVTAVAG